MPVTLTAEQEIHVGTPIVVEGPSPNPPYATVFEDDGDTGYFYALDIEQEGNPIVDAVHIYNVEQVTDRNQPSTVRICWSQDKLKAVLLINDYPHAIFDFAARKGYCRTGFPPPDAEGTWASHDHSWQDEAVELFA